MNNTYLENVILYYADDFESRGWKDTDDVYRIYNEVYEKAIRNLAWAKCEGAIPPSPPTPTPKLPIAISGVTLAIIIAVVVLLLMRR